MKRGGKSVPRYEVGTFKRLFTADVNSDGWKNKWAETWKLGEREKHKR